MRAQVAVPVLGLLLLAGCHEPAEPAPTATESIGSDARAPTGASAMPPQPPAALSASQAPAPSAAVRGVIRSLKADSLRDMEGVRGTRLQVGGIFIKRTVARQGGPPSEHPLHTNNTVWLADDKDETDLLRCDLGEGWAAGVEPLDRIIVEGTAAFEDPSTIHNGPKELRFARCTVKKAQ